MTKKSPTSTSVEKSAASQVEKFRQAARQVETDDSEEHFDRTLKKVASKKPVVSAEDDDERK